MAKKQNNTIETLTGHYVAITSESHGGGCCGRRHIYELGQCGPTENRVTLIQDCLSHCESDGYDNYDEEDNEIEYPDIHTGDHGCEITLTKQQATLKQNSAFHSAAWKADKYYGQCWDDVLKEMGWKRVYSFKNPNTDNVIFVYFYSNNVRTNRI